MLSTALDGLNTPWQVVHGHTYDAMVAEVL